MKKLNKWDNRLKKDRERLYDDYNGQYSGTHSVRAKTYRISNRVVHTNESSLVVKKPIKSTLIKIATAIIILMAFIMVPPVLGGAPLSDIFTNIPQWFNYAPVEIPSGSGIFQSIDQTVGRLFVDIGKSLSYSLGAILVGISISIPFAFLASNNVFNNKLVNQTARISVTIMRALPILTIGMMFNKAMYAEVTGFITMTLFIFPIFTKWLYEDLDDIDRNTIKSMEALGFSKMKIFRTTILPTLSSRLFASSFYMLEIAFRFSAALYVIGDHMGGIGLSLGRLSFQDPTHWGHLKVTILIIASVVIMFSMVNKILEKYIINYKTKRVFVKDDDIIDSPEFTDSFISAKPKLHKILSVVLITSLFAAAIYSIASMPVENWTFKAGAADLQTQLRAMLNPNLGILTATWDLTNPIYGAMESLWLVIAVFVLSIVLSIPFGLLSSSKITSKPVAGFFSTLLSIIRAVPGYVFVLFWYPYFFGNHGLFAAVLGLGTNAIGSVGTRIKMLADTTPDSFGNNIKANGGTKMDFIRHALIPQMLPEIIARSTYQLEISFKNLLILGGFGISSFGQQFYDLSRASGTEAYMTLSSFILVFVMVSILIEIVTIKLRNSIRNDKKSGSFQLYWLQIMFLNARIRFNSIGVSILTPFRAIDLGKKSNRSPQLLINRISEHNSSLLAVKSKYLLYRKQFKLSLENQLVKGDL